MQAYRVADSAGYIKLDAMENPYPWPASMIEQWLDRLRECKPNRYPDPQANALKKVIAQTGKIPPGSKILLGNGSDEIIQLILMAIAGPGAVVLAPEPCFVMYRQIAVSLGIKYVGVPLKGKDFDLDMPAMRSAIRRHNPSAVFMAYPNNPTGNLFAENDIAEILSIAQGLVIIDEAYEPFAETSFMPRLPKFHHMLIMRTVSKLGLAGLRLGYLVGHDAWIDQLDKLRLPYNINVLTQSSAEFALSNIAFLDQQTSQIRKDREDLYARLLALPGIMVYPSRTNFLLFKTDKCGADEIFHALEKVGILLKNLNPSGRLLKDCLRVTVGTPEENEAFLKALQTILANAPI